MRIPRDARGLWLGIVLALPAGPALAQRTSDLRAEAYRLYDAGRYREALPYLDAVLDRRHRDIEAHIRRGNAHLRLDEPEQALADFDRVVPFAAFYPGVFADRGIAHTMLGQLDAARDDFTKAIALYSRPAIAGIPVGAGDINSSWNVSNPPAVYTDRKGQGRAVAHCGLGQVYHRMGQDEAAIAEYNQALRLNPLDPNSHAGRGDALAALGQIGPALADYDEALRLAPNHAHALAARGEALARTGETDKTLADYDRAIRIDPGSARTRRLRAALLSRMGRNEEALADLDAVLQVDPKDAGALKDRGGVLVRMGRAEKAIADLDRSIALDPGRASAYLNRGAAYNALGQHERAIADLEEAIKREPGGARAYTNRGLARLAIGQADRAIADLSEAIRLDPKDATAHYQRAEVYSRLGLPSEAIADYDATIRLAPQFAPAFAGRGHALDALGRRDEAIGEYDMAIRLSPSVVGVYGDRGIARRARGDWPGAIADFSRVIELDPKRADAYAWRGWSRLVAAVDGADDDARSYLRLRRRDDANSAYMAILGALASRRAGRVSEAERFLDEALVAISPRSWPAPVLRYLKHLITAEALLDAADDDRQMTEARVFLGLDLLDSGHRTVAVDHLRWVCEHGVDRIVAPDLAREALRRIEGTDTLPPAIP